MRALARVVVALACAVSATVRVSASGLDSVASRARTVRVYGDDARGRGASTGSMSGGGGTAREYEYEYEYGDEAWMDETWWREFETADSGRRRGTDAAFAAPRTFDEYVELEVAKLEVSLLEQSSGTDADREAIRRTLDDIAYDIQADLERVARTRAEEMTYRGDFAPAYHPPADFVAYQNDAYVIYDADGSRVMFEPQGEIGRLMQQLTWFSTIFPGNPTALDDYMRCATLVRPCSVEEVLRKCTYEPRGTWYRERISRMNAPLTWSYCQPDLEQVYEYCTPIEVQGGLCDPRRARAHVPLTNRRDQRRRSAVFALAHEHIWNEGVHRLGTSLSVQGVVIVKAASEVFSRASFITCPPRRFLRDNFRHRSSRRRPSCRIATPACSSPYRCRTTDARRRGPPPCVVSPRWTVECPPWRP